MPERVVALAREVSHLVTSRIHEIQDVTRMTKILGINALIQASHAGEAGKSFAVVAEEVGRVSDRIRSLAGQLQEQLGPRVDELDRLGQQLVADIRGRRLADLALNMIEIIDRNLYERSCDVRWWATDSAVVDCLGRPSEEASAYASRRLGVILDSYTVYLDLWVLDLQGQVRATGRPGQFPDALRARVGQETWFKEALATVDGSRYTVGDIGANAALRGRKVATYATAIRAGGENDGEPLGVLAIFFDWEAQARTVVESVRLNESEREISRCLLLDAQFRVIAASDRRGILEERFPLDLSQGPRGSYASNDGRLVGYALTPGYETYEGLGWYGVITQQLRAQGSLS